MTNKPLAWGLAATAGLLALFWFTDLDLAASKAAFSLSQPHWPLGEEFPWRQLKRYGEWPGAAAGCLGGLAFLFSFQNHRRRAWRGPGLYLFLLFSLGPGLLVNVLGKGLCGRPRPEQLDLFAGFWEFRRPLQLGLPGRGQSFLSGHASMGFFWFGLFFLWAGRPRRWLGLGLGLVMGGLLTTARILQGGHFLSDGLLCGALMFSLAAALSPLIHWQPGKSFLRRRGLKPALAGFLAGLVLVIKPLYEERRHVFRPYAPVSDPGLTSRDRVYATLADPVTSADLGLSLKEGDIQVRFDGEAVASGRLPLVLLERARASGFPGSTIPPLKVQAAKGDELSYDFSQEWGGPVWDFHALYLAHLPSGLPAQARLKTEKGRIIIGTLPLGRKVLLYGWPSAAPPADFKPFGMNGHLREGEGPMIVLVLDAPDIRFE